MLPLYTDFVAYYCEGHDDYILHLMGTNAGRAVK